MAITVLPEIKQSFDDMMDYVGNIIVLSIRDRNQHSYFEDHSYRDDGKSLVFDAAVHEI